MHASTRALVFQCNAFVHPPPIVPDAKALADRDHQTLVYLPAFATTNATWAPSSFPSDGANGAGAYDFVPNAADGRDG